MKKPAGITATIFLCFLVSFGQEDFPSGQITRRVTCLNDTAQHYAVFVPRAYTDTLSWPVIFFFEPAARALLPLERYATLADRFGYFMCCSYNSRNGPNEPIFEAANAMYADAFNRFSLDKEQVCLAGFSGGARISCLIANSSTDIPSVIGCGAGFPFSKMPEQATAFDYCGIIGKQDMNFQELLLLDSTLDQYNRNHILLTFPDGHRWPDSSTFRSAFFWLVTKAMRTGLTPSDALLLDGIKSEYDAKIETLRHGSDPLLLARSLKNVMVLLEGLRDIGPYRSEYNNLLLSPQYMEALEDHYSIVDIESTQQQRYWSEFEQISLRALDPDRPVKSVSWWKKQFRKIDGLEDPDLRARLHEFVVNGSWEQHINSLRAEHFAVAMRYLDVYEAGLPGDPSPDYFRARVFALSGDPAAMYRCLEKAVDNGLSSPDRIKEDDAFSAYMGQGKMKDMVKELELKNEKVK